jgi:hypothetical protein
MPTSVSTPDVSEFFSTTSGTPRYLNYQLPTPNISYGGQSALSRPLADIVFPQPGIIVILIGQAQVSNVSLTVQDQLDPQHLQLMSGPVTRTDLAMAAWATGAGIHGKELRVEFEDGD